MSSKQKPLSPEPVTALVEYPVRKEECSAAEWLNVWATRRRDALHGKSGMDAHVNHPAHAELLANLSNQRARILVVSALING